LSVSGSCISPKREWDWMKHLFKRWLSCRVKFPWLASNHNEAQFANWTTASSLFGPTTSDSKTRLFWVSYGVWLHEGTVAWGPWLEEVL
jgi:hypothetical protein